MLYADEYAQTQFTYYSTKLFHCSVVAMYCINFCILALGSGQRLLYRLGSGLGLGLVLVLVLRCNAIAHTVLHVSLKYEYCIC